VKQRILILILAVAVLLSIVVSWVFLFRQAQPEMTDQELRLRIGQMLLVGFRGTEVTESATIIRALRELNLGGVVLYNLDVPSGRTFPRNIVNPGQVQRLSRDLQRSSPTLLFIAIDVEGGKVNRLKPQYGFPEIPSAQEMGQGSAKQIERTADQLGQELADLGINWDFAPVVDVNINPENPVIGALGRSFSADPGQVAQDGAAFIRGLHQSRIISCLKHCPGHGSSSQDSHLGLVDVTDSWRSEELIPYRELIETGLVDAVMTAHVMNRTVDPVYPATLSPIFLENLLRNTLLFQGVIVSDDMEMGSIVQHFGFADALVRAVNAGCDLLILSNNGQTYDDEIAWKARDILFTACKEGQILPLKIWQASERIAQLKQRYGLLASPPIP